ncbi:hypothetical protein Bpfe_015614 [Biomphalaria pfeifferi]|uniref:Uncharacterized protein n=1 Tax=Biomphalaria pfeifferi TaxID=112525 RepID=A0AAD8BIK7_BIOPF|nr:hypothetical protein Bpfe_015612 [Biomphalaria pfeifferi]KAK0055038.1 hypothetical protein Bpfe_015614 [Biomphalaria pfeifferi]
MYQIEGKETNEETEVCYVPEAFVPVGPVTRISMSRTYQDKVGTLKISAGAYEGNWKLDNCLQKFSMSCTCGASHREFRCQENHQQSMCTAISLTLA